MSTTSQNAVEEDERAYLTHYGLNAWPFVTTPNPRLSFPTLHWKVHRASLDKVVAERQGVGMITGEPGTGKSSLAEEAYSTWRARSDRYVVGMLARPIASSPAQFLRLVLAAFGVEKPLKPQTQIEADAWASARAEGKELAIRRTAPREAKTEADLWGAVEQFVVETKADGKTPILIVDEAQVMKPGVFVTLMHLSNLQTAAQKYLQVILLGQPELRARLAETANRALGNRIAYAGEMVAMSVADLEKMLRLRITECGGVYERIFESGCAARLHAVSAGMPRTALHLADQAAVMALMLGKDTVDDDAMEQAAQWFTGAREWVATNEVTAPRRRAAPSSATSGATSSANKDARAAKKSGGRS